MEQMFIALEHKQTNASMHALSPQVMQWCEGVCLYDLRPCLSYWEMKAKGAGLSLFEFFARFLTASIDGEFRGVLASQPWQAILLTQHMRSQGLWGLVDRRDRLGTHLYHNLSWHTWWECVRVAASWFEKNQWKSFKLAAFRQRSRQMQQAIERLGVATPWELTAVGAQAIYRRYGATLKMLWDWSYPATQSLLVDDVFPWQGVEQAATYAVKRHLDTPLCEWSHIESFLRDDFDRLCELTDKDGVSQQRIVSLEWQLSLADASLRTVPIRFRHPHSLTREKSAHGTALLQAHYSFQGDVHSQKMKAMDEGLPLFEAIMGWEIRIKEFIYLPPRCVDLFGDSDADESALLDLENRLPVLLHHYDLRNDWTPEESFAVYGSDSLSRQDQTENEAFLSMHALAKRRPLFLFRDQQPLKQDGRSSLWRFSERTMAKWWQQPKQETSQESAPLFCDYYRYIDNKKRALWVCRRASESWYVHGIFA